MSSIESAARSKRVPELDIEDTASTKYLAETDEESSKTPIGNSKSQIRQFLREIANFPVLSQAEITELCSKAQNNTDPDARNKIMNHNLRFVVFIAHKYKGRGVDFADLIQEGTLGLMTAINKYDFHKHQTQFATYAFYWIRKAMVQAIENHASTIRKAVNIQLFHKKIYCIREQFRADNGRLPTPEEIAKVGQLDLTQVKIALGQLFGKTLSLNEAIYLNRDKKFTLITKLVDHKTLTPEQTFAAVEELHISLRKIKLILDSIRTFSKRNQDIFIARFGLDGTLEGKTLEAVGDRFGLCKESIRLIADEICKTLQTRGIISDPSCINKEVEKISNLCDIALANNYMNLNAVDL